MDKDLPEILREVRQMGGNLERSSSGVKGAVERRKQGVAAFVRQLGGLGWLLENCKRPSGLDEWDFQLIRPLCEKLVEKQQLPPAILDLFEEPEAETPLTGRS